MNGSPKFSAELLHVYIINMDHAVERWRYVENEYRKTGLRFTRVSGIVGARLNYPISDFDEAKYRRRHGQIRCDGQVGCYLSHVKSLRLFLESDYEWAVISEDDSSPVEDLASILTDAMKYYECWDILRLCGFHNPHSVSFVQLPSGSELAVCFSRLCGTGSYMVSRHAAEVLIQKLLPMYLPIDHAIDREWAYGLRAAAVIPLPVSQSRQAFASQIVTTSAASYKVPSWTRYLTVFPWRFVNETSRATWRFFQLVRAGMKIRSTRSESADQRSPTEHAI